MSKIIVSTLMARVLTIFPAPEAKIIMRRKEKD